MRSKRSKIAHRHQSLIFLITVTFLLAGILCWRTYSYFKQVEVNVAQVQLRQGPGIEYQAKGQLKRGSRMTVLREKYRWYYVKTANNKFGWVASWNLNPQGSQTVTKLNNATIVLDPGHGGSDSGALSANGKMEKTYTLKLAKKVAALLRQKGAKVYLTRTSDKFVSLAARPALSNQVHANAFISFHFDSSPQQNLASGVTTYYYHRQLSYSLAHTINQQLNNLNLKNRGIDFGNFEVIRDNDYPAVLLEMGYINSDHDFAEIRSNQYLAEVANDVVKGLSNYFATSSSTN
ncbi:N-acetylmuramoyl-L-alanine amidase [Liquorilactobacillus sicerae]|uniref:N-acetylmuramoyl-L-alanine amidase n=1 Tax=Liquorilactobacillus sicerae TaxID=1416943 RepID=UPI0024817D0F|nr:N-acetylmuramoyl-L-alanine amidase [Liquorilactobacillus sicerae]